MSRLLRAVENWPLLIAVMRELLHKILDLRRLLVDDLHAGEEMLRYMQDFEVLSSEGGSEALEHDFCGAASVVKVRDIFIPLFLTLLSVCISSQYLNFSVVTRTQLIHESLTMTSCSSYRYLKCDHAYLCNIWSTILCALLNYALLICLSS